MQSRMELLKRGEFHKFDEEPVMNGGFGGDESSDNDEYKLQSIENKKHKSKRKRPSKKGKE